MNNNLTIEETLDNIVGIDNTLSQIERGTYVSATPGPVDLNALKNQLIADRNQFTQAHDAQLIAAQARSFANQLKNRMETLTDPADKNEAQHYFEMYTKIYEEFAAKHDERNKREVEVRAEAATPQVKVVSDKDKAKEHAHEVLGIDPKMFKEIKNTRELEAKLLSAFEIQREQIVNQGLSETDRKKALNELDLSYKYVRLVNGLSLTEIEKHQAQSYANTFIRNEKDAVAKKETGRKEFVDKELRTMLTRLGVDVEKELKKAGHKVEDKILDFNPGWITRVMPTNAKLNDLVLNAATAEEKNQLINDWNFLVTLDSATRSNDPKALKANERLEYAMGYLKPDAHVNTQQTPQQPNQPQQNRQQPQQHERPRRRFGEWCRDVWNAIKGTGISVDLGRINHHGDPHHANRR